MSGNVWLLSGRLTAYGRVEGFSKSQSQSRQLYAHNSQWNTASMPSSSCPSAGVYNFGKCVAQKPARPSVSSRPLRGGGSWRARDPLLLQEPLYSSKAGPFRLNRLNYLLALYSLKKMVNVLVSFVAVSSLIIRQCWVSVELRASVASEGSCSKH